MYPRPIRKWFRAVFERGCLAAWMIVMVANTVVVGLATELLVFGVIFSLNNIILINQQTAPLLVLGIFCTMAFSVIVRLRQYGIEYLNFEVHEAALNQMIEPPESWSTLILTLLDESAAKSQELATLVQLIDEAPGPVERQDRRAEAKLWLQENRTKLTVEDKALVNERLGYLK